MRVAAFRGEVSVAAIADKVYAGLSAASREKAVAALLKENPQLGRLDKVKPGTALTIPEVPGLRPKPGRGLEGPEDELAHLLAESLGAYGKALGERHDAFQMDLKEQANLLKDPKVRKVLEASPTASELAARAADAVRAQAKEAADTRKRLEAAIEKLTSDLSRR